jgi:hypothetical protein
MQPETAGRACASGGARLKRRRSEVEASPVLQLAARAHTDPWICRYQVDMRHGMARRVEAGCAKKKKDFG